MYEGNYMQYHVVVVCLLDLIRAFNLNHQLLSSDFRQVYSICMATVDRESP